MAFTIITTTGVVAETVGNNVDDAVDSVKSGAKSTGHAIERGADSTGNAIKSGANSTSDAFKSGTNSTKTTFSDQDLEHKVNNALSAEVPSGSFTVASQYAHILLAGQVPTKADKKKAERAAKDTAGVKGVWNYLTVEANENAEAISKDAMLTTNAKDKLLMQKGVNSNNIKVVTSNAVVYLLGRNAGKSHKIKLAAKDISQIDGVSKVVNLIGK